MSISSRYLEIQEYGGGIRTITCSSLVFRWRKTTIDFVCFALFPEDGKPNFAAVDKEKKRTICGRGDVDNH